MALEGLAYPLSDAPLMPPPLGTLPHRAKLRDLLRRAKRERRGLDIETLTPRIRVAAHLHAFVLARVQARLEGFEPERSDATWYFRRLDPTLRELEYRGLRGACPSCAAFLHELAHRLREIPSELGAASSPNLRSALARADDLRARLLALPLLFGPDFPQHALDESVEALAAARRVLREQVDHIDTAATIEWERTQRLGPQKQLRRLPRYLGATELKRRLRTEYAMTRKVEILYADTHRTIRKYHGMRSHYAKLPAGSKSESCIHEWRNLADWAASQLPELDARDPNCLRLFPWLQATRPRLPLRLAVVDWSLTYPAQRSRREAAPDDPGTAITSAGAHRHTRRVAISAARRHHTELLWTLDTGLHTLCLTATALWLHGSLGPASELDAWLTTACPASPTEKWHRIAAADPRHALRGVALVYALTTPLHLEYLDRYPRIPAGTLDRMATADDLAANDVPRAKTPKATTTLRVSVEEL